MKFDWMNFIGIGYGNESSMNEVFVVEVFNFDNWKFFFNFLGYGCYFDFLFIMWIFNGFNINLIRGVKWNIFIVVEDVF